MQTPLQQILFACNIPTRSYSGRGMYGESCLAFGLGETSGEVFARILDIIAAEPGVYPTGDIARSFSYMRQERLGYGTIYYFPGIPFNEEGPQPENFYDND